jgi:hypothetical protein
MGEKIISRTDVDTQKGQYVLANVPEKHRQLGDSRSC